MKLIAYWARYKLMLKEVPIDQTHIIIEHFHHDWLNNLYEYDYHRVRISDVSLFPLRAIRAVNLERFSLEYLDYLCAKYQVRFVR